MAVDIYYAGDTQLKERLFGLNDDDFERLKLILIEFKRLTGIVIDQYGKTRIHYDHIQLIIKILEQHINAVERYSLKEKDLMSIKDKFKKINSDVIALGD